MPKSDDTSSTPRFIVLGSICVVLAALYFAQEVLIPLALAILLSFLLAPLVKQLERLRLPRGVAVVITVLFTLGVLFGIGYVVYDQLGELKTEMPTYEQHIKDKLASIRGPGGILNWVHTADAQVKQALAPTTTSSTQPAMDVRVINNDSESSQSQSSPMDVLRPFISIVLGPLGTAFIVTVFAIFMLQQREDLRDRFIRLLGRNRLTLTTTALDDAAARVSRYLLMQSIVNGSVGATILVVLWTLGKFNHMSFPAVALWGLLTALLRFIPYVGIWVSSALPIALALAVFPQSRVALEVFFAYGTVEVVAANFLEPMLYGSSTGIATLAVLVAAAFWAWLWGPVGLLLSTPLTVCLVVMGKYVPQLEFLTILLGEEPALSPSDRVYQRLLALDQEEAAFLVNEYSKKMSLEELYDTVLIQTLSMVEQDVLQGNLNTERQSAIHEGVRSLVDELGDQARAAETKAEAQALVDEARGETPTQPVLVDPARIGLPKGCVLSVVCLPASRASDEIAATMLGQLLELRGYCVTIASVEKLASEMVETVKQSKPDIVCVSAFHRLPSRMQGICASACRVCCRMLKCWLGSGAAIGIFRRPKSESRR